MGNETLRIVTHSCLAPNADYSTITPLPHSS